MRYNLTILGSLALATALATGCAPTSAGSSTGGFPSGNNNNNNNNNNGNGTDGGTPGTPGDGGYTPPTNPLDNGAKYSGVYTANAKLDFTQPGVLPGLVSPALAALSEIGTDPGDALVDFAQAAGAINLSSSLRSIVGSVITQQLNNVLPQNVKDDLTLISNITAITRTSTLQNQMTVHTPSSTGSVQVDIQVQGVAFDFVDLNLDSQHVVVQSSASTLAASKSTITATLQPHSNAPTADADLIFNGGTLSLPIGDWVLQAMGPLVFEPEWGTTDLQSTLQAMMQSTCADLGPIVEQGVMDITSLDVGATVGTTICTTAVNLAATEITNEIEKLKINGVKVSNGRATLFDISPDHPTVDHQSDLLGNGSWTWSFGGADVPAAILDGKRVGNSI